MKTAGLWMYTAIPRELYVIVFEIEMLALFFFFGLVHPGFVVCHMLSDICSLSSNKKLPRLRSLR